MTRERLPEIGPIKPMMRQKCGTCANWIADFVEWRREAGLHMNHGTCTIHNLGQFYHAGGMCPDWEAI